MVASAAAGVLALAHVLGSALAEDGVANQTAPAVANETAPAEDAGSDPVDWASVLFFIICYGISQYSQWLERRLATDHR